MVPLPRLLPLTALVLGCALVWHGLALFLPGLGVVPATSLMLASARAATPPGTAAPAAPAAAATPAAASASPSPAPAKTNSGSAAAHSPTSAATHRLALLQDLQARSKALDARQAALDARSMALAAAETRLRAQIGQLSKLQQQLQTLNTARQQREKANWQSLVKMYEAMPPRRAAAIFNDLDMTVLLPLLDRMQDRSAAQILAAMLPERARLATTRLADLRARREALSAAK